MSAIYLIRASVFLFRQTVSGKSISMPKCAKKSCGRLLMDVFLQKYELFKFEFAIFIADLCTHRHISKRIRKSKFGHAVFFFNYWSYSLPISKGIGLIPWAPNSRMFGQLVRRSKRRRALPKFPLANLFTLIRKWSFPKFSPGIIFLSPKVMNFDRLH